MQVSIGVHMAALGEHRRGVPVPIQIGMPIGCARRRFCLRRLDRGFCRRLRQGSVDPVLWREPPTLAQQHALEPYTKQRLPLPLCRS